MFRRKHKKRSKHENLINGKKHSDKNYLSFIDNLVRRIFIPLVPSYIQTYHLTLCTLIFAIPMLASGFLAKQNLTWFWLHPILIILQFITDVLDGEIGRIRNTGLVRWGFYADHLFDFIFNNCLLITYSFIFPNHILQIFIILSMLNLLFLHEAFNTLILKEQYNKYGYSGFGSTEIRAVIILIDIIFIVFSPRLTPWILDLILISSFLFLVKIIYEKQKQIWQVDMKYKDLEKKLNN